MLGQGGLGVTYDANTNEGERVALKAMSLRNMKGWKVCVLEHSGAVKIHVCVITKGLFACMVDRKQLHSSTFMLTIRSYVSLHAVCCRIWSCLKERLVFSNPCSTQALQSTSTTSRCSLWN